MIQRHSQTDHPHKFQDTKISRKTEFLTEFLWCSFDLCFAHYAIGVIHKPCAGWESGFFTSSGIFQKVTEKSHWDSKIFKMSPKNIAEISKVSFLSLIFVFFVKSHWKKLLKFQKSTFCHWFSKNFFRNFLVYRFLDILTPFPPFMNHFT